MVEFTTVSLDTSDLVLDKKGVLQLQIDDFATDVTDANEVTFTDGGAIASDWQMAKMGLLDGQPDVFRFNLTGFNDDFNITIISEGVEDLFSISTTSAPTIVGGVYTFTYVGSDGLEHTVTITPGDAQVEWSIVCFAAGTMIRTINGEVLVEELKISDLVLTMDEGFKPIRWIGSRRLESFDLMVKPHLRPIRISSGSLGDGLPDRDLVVSPQHRVLVRSNLVERLFGEREVLIASKKLLEIDGIDIVEDTKAVEYFHVLFDDHQIIWSNGAPTESLFTGPQALRSISPDARAEIFAIFPELEHGKPEASAPPVRQIVHGKRVQRLIDRTKASDKALVEWR
jgi:Hint domain